MKRVTLVSKTDEGYIIRTKLGKKRWLTALAVPDEGTTEKDAIALAIAIANGIE